MLHYSYKSIILEATMKKVKTNAMRLLEDQNIDYELLSFSLKADAITPEYIAEEIGKEVERIFKTIVTEGTSGNHYVFCLQIIKELDLKKAAKAAGEKSISLIDQRDLLKVAGYEKGGCSPVGMKKLYRTFYDAHALSYDRIIVSAGKRGYQIEVPVEGLLKATEGQTSDLLMETKSIFR